MFDALEAGDWPRALAAALDAWRTTRSPALAHLVDAVSARVPRLALPNRQRHAWWMKQALAYEPATAASLVALAHDRAHKCDGEWHEVHARLGSDRMISRLLAESSRREVTLTLPQHQRNRVERFAAFARWPEDPRVATVLAHWFVRDCFTWAAPHDETVAVFFEMLAEELERIGDARVIPLLDECIARPRGRTHKLRLQQQTLASALSRSLRKREQPLEPEIARRVAGWLTELAPTKPALPPPIDERGLWHAIAEDRDALAPRIVLADYLQERGDRRGELFTLQMSDTPNAESLANTLIAEQWNEWLGDLALIVKRREVWFIRGVLERASIGLDGSPDWAYAASGQHRELITLRRVRPTFYARAEQYAAFLGSLAVMPEHVTLTPEQLEPLRPLAFAEVELEMWRNVSSIDIGYVVELLLRHRIHTVTLSHAPMEGFVPAIRRLAGHVSRVAIRSWRDIEPDLEALAREVTIVEIQR